MSRPSPRLLRSLWGLCLVAGVAFPRGRSETTHGLWIQPYAGLTITGTVGLVYAIEYIPDLVQANRASAWRCLEFLQLPASPYLWVDSSVPATGQRFYRSVPMPAPTNMVFIPPGRFRLGSRESERDRGEYEGPEMMVTVSRGFWMGEFEVTAGEYEAVMGGNPSWFAGEADRPVERVSWEEATRYCEKLTSQERALGRIAANATYRLPTEAEWEYACRAWTSTRFSHGDDPDYAELGSYAWFAPEGGFTTHVVGGKLPNPWGLHDMYGNVWEWCQDWFDTYPGGSAVDPQGPDTGVYRVLRGGVWGDGPRRCRSADRSCSDPAGGNFDIGFRVVLAPGRP